MKLPVSWCFYTLFISLFFSFPYYYYLPVSFFIFPICFNSLYITITFVCQEMDSKQLGKTFKASLVYKQSFFFRFSLSPAIILLKILWITVRKFCCFYCWCWFCHFFDTTITTLSNSQVYFVEHPSALSVNNNSTKYTGLDREIKT